jgi:gliding motility-associated-like protein
VEFTNLSTSADGNIVESIWGLGGSSGVVVDNGSSPAITSTYTTPDSYNVSLTVTDNNGCTNTANKQDFIIVSPDPVVEVSAPQTFSCNAPFTVVFKNNSNTQDMSYFWDFGNGTFYTGLNPPQVVYPTFGSYTPIIIGTNTITGCADTLVMTDYIQVGHPIEFSMSTTAGCEDLSVSFTDQSIDAASTVEWDFGDGSPVSNQANPTHVYTNPGCYTVTLTRTVNGCTAFRQSDTCIEVYQLPGVNYGNTAPIGCTAPHNVQFFGGSGNPNVIYAWNFGDGNTSDLQNPNHTYMDYGTYQVSLTVTDENGCTSSINTDEILIQTIEARIPVDTMEGCTPLDITLNSISTSPTPITNYEWEVVNNSTAPPAVHISSAQQPDFTLIDTGYYEIRLIVTNDLGCKDTSVFYEQIAVGQPPEMGFTADPLISCVETPISFIDQGASYTNDWLWDFGDGGFGYGQIPEHEYIDTGYFDVTLFAYHHSCENELTIDSFVYIQPPIAQFTVERDCESPFVVSIVDNSTAADSIIYDFGIDGVEWDTTSEREPVFVYPATGNYTITMTVFNSETGCQDDVTRLVRIRDIQSAFTLNNPLEGCVPMVMSFTNNSQDVETYEWTASGGNFSNAAAANPTLTFNTPGTYSDIQLIVTDINGCRDTSIFTETIFANGINADFTIDPSDGCRPLTVTFEDLSSSTFGTIIDWQWNFDGGAPNETIPDVTTTFENIGDYDISLTLTDDWGCTATRNIPEGVKVTFPLVSFYADTLSCTERQVNFTNTSVGRGMSYVWDFGDGETSTTTSPSHFYQNEGIYSVCLTATDVNGCDSTFCIPDYIVIANPVAQLMADETFTTCPPLIVNFENQSLNATDYNWDFGDNGGTSDLENPAHIYTEPGNFDVTLIASFEGYCIDTLILPDYIIVEGPVGSFTFDIDSACIPAVITFYGESVDNYNYTWDFGNGELQSTSNVNADTIQYTYTEIGQYVPKLSLQDDNNCIRAFESPDTIYLEQLSLDFMATDSIICTGEESTTFINLTNSSLPLAYADWIFPGGDPGTSTAFEPMITFDSAGVFDITLISSNGFCTDTLTKPAYIKVGETPVAAFMMSDSADCAPALISFTDLSTVGAGYIAQWQWNFDDGDESDFQNPSHTFNETGAFNVSLTITTDIGCTDEATNEMEIYELPEVQIPEPYNICIGNEISLEVEILSDTTGIIYYWLDSPTLSCTDCLVPEANPVDTTTYYFVLQNSIGCADTSAVIVEVRPFQAPIVNISNDTTICANTIIQLFADGGNSIYEYQWDPNAAGLSCYENCFNPIASPITSTLYTVSVTNEFDCQTVEDVLVDVVDQSQSFAGPDRTICEGNEVQLNVETGNDPIWLVTDGLSCAYCPDPIASPDVSTTYVVQVTTDIGCEIIDSVTVNVRSESDIDAGEDLSLCSGEQVTLDAIGFGTPTWISGANLSDPNIFNPVASPNTNSTYVLSVTEGECTLLDSFSIEVITQVEVFVDNQTICEGDSIQLLASGNAESYRWTPAEGLSDPTIANPTASPQETTTYTVTGSLGTCQDGQASAIVTVIPGPATNLTRVYDFFPGQTVDLEVTTEELAGYTYAWSPINLVSCVSCNNPQVTVDTTTLFTVLVTDPETGCGKLDSTLVRRQDNCPEDLVGVPNIFTPNNDGMNDKLELHLSPAVQPTGIELWQIFDRWGALIFESRDAQEGWDGTYKGKPLPAGVYIYYIEAPCPIGDGKIMKKGDITLLK